jgi:mono/diheme cytochrome c family protein
MGIRSFNRVLSGTIVAATLVFCWAPGRPAATAEIARPSNPGGPGEAATMIGNTKAGAKIFAANCMPCHGAEGKGGVPNPGSTDGTVPPLNPIDETMVSRDPKVFAYNVDLFVQNGSTPEGPNPAIKMPAWGADHLLEQKQIADVIAFVMSLNSNPAGQREGAKEGKPGMGPK